MPKEWHSLPYNPTHAAAAKSLADRDIHGIDNAACDRRASAARQDRALRQDSCGGGRTDYRRISARDFRCRETRAVETPQPADSPHLTFVMAHVRHLSKAPIHEAVIDIRVIA